jgi:alpha-tubulin suppressor-like RCC1 family protein
MLRYTVSSPGKAWIVVAAGNKADTIHIDAVAVGFKSVSLANDFGCGIALDDTAWCWGANTLGQLGHRTAFACGGSKCWALGNPTPVRAGSEKFVTISASGGGSCMLQLGISGTCGQTCALTAGGETWCWGEQFGAPKRVAPDVVFTSLTGRGSRSGLEGGSVACGLTALGKAFCIGVTATSPLLPDMTFQSLSLGRHHTCAIDLEGETWCWGDNTYGALGTGTTTSSATPVKPISSVKFVAVAAGTNSTCALDTTGAIHCWGEGYSATGTTPPGSCIQRLCQLTPRVVDGSRTYTGVSRGDGTHLLCGLTGSGAVDCWDFYNQAPHTVALPEPARSISIGDGACAVSATHVLYCWTGASGTPAKLGQ